MFSLSRRIVPRATASTTTTSSSSTACLLFNSLRFQSSSSENEKFRAEIADVANCFKVAESNKIPLGKVIHGVTPATKSKIFKSGKGLEGYLRQFPSSFAVEKTGSEKFLLLVDERLKQQSGSSSASSNGVGGEDAVSDGAGTSGNNKTTVAPDINTLGVQVIRPPPRAKTQYQLDRDNYLRDKNERQKHEQMEREAREREARLSSSSPSSSGGAGASSGNMWVDEIMQQEKDAKNAQGELEQANKAASTPESASGDEEAVVNKDAGDSNMELTSRVKACLPGENQWYKIQAIHEALYRGTNVQLSPFVQFLMNAPKHFWVDAKNGFVCRRLAYHTEAPPNLQIKQAAAAAAGRPNHEWGESKNAPTSQDVYEILRYIPIHWTDFGGIQIPDSARKKHIRISSKLTWFARQPKFFDLRWIGGSIEIRRAPVLHPGEHGMTKEEAEAYVQKRIKEDTTLGTPLVLLQARGIQPAGYAGATTVTPSSSSSDASNNNNTSSSTTATTSSSTSSSSPSAASVASNSSAIVDAVTKALIRIAPGYFVTAEAIMRRATKKMTDNDLAIAVERSPLMVERVVVQSKTNPKHKVSLYRRKLGVDDSQWKPELIKELEESPNLKLLSSLMTHSCAQWDRTHFLYVRLPDVDKVESGGFEEMVNFLRLHPQCFRVGEYFVKRNDLSDPGSADADPEPTSKMVLNTKQLEDNPYHQLIDLANVFHYLIPEGESVSLSHFVDSSSPAMRSVLPPRILTILQAYPEKFNCREIAPGTYSVSRANTAGNVNNTAAASSTQQQYTSSGGDGSNQPISSVFDDDSTAGGGAGDQETLQVATMSKEEAVEKLIAIVPQRGVDIAHIEATMPQTLRRAIVRLFGAGGVATLVAENLNRFYVVKNPPYQTIFVRQKK